MPDDYMARLKAGTVTPGDWTGAQYRAQKAVERHKATGPTMRPANWTDTLRSTIDAIELPGIGSVAKALGISRTRDPYSHADWMPDPPGGGLVGSIDDTAIKGLRQASKGFSLQGALDDILRGGGGALDEVVDVGAKSGPTALNASGESAASLESLGRRAWEAQTQRKLVRLDRAGRETPFLGEPGDLRVNPGERVGYRTPDGRFEEITRGR